MQLKQLVNEWKAKSHNDILRDLHDAELVCSNIYDYLDVKLAQLPEIKKL